MSIAKLLINALKPIQLISLKSTKNSGTQMSFRIIKNIYMYDLLSNEATITNRLNDEK